MTKPPLATGTPARSPLPTQLKLPNMRNNHPEIIPVPWRGGLWRGPPSPVGSGGASAGCSSASAVLG